MKVEIHFLPKEEPAESDEASDSPSMRVPIDQAKLLELANKITYEDHETAPVLSITYTTEDATNDEIPKKKIKTRGSDKVEKNEDPPQ